MLNAERLKARMIDQEVSQAGLARRVGVSQQTIARLVSGGSYGSRYLHLIARELATTPAYLTGETDDPNAEAPDISLSSEQIGWVNLLQSLPAKDRGAILHLAQTISAAGKV